MAVEEDVVLTSAAQLLLLLHQENVDKDVDRVGCVSLGRSINFKVLSLHPVAPRSCTLRFTSLRQCH